MNCPECSATMIEESHPGVTIERCSECDGLWFDMEEMYNYVRQESPSARFLPTDDDFSRHTKGIGDTCPCCEEEALEMGGLAGFTFRKCTWCGGIFIAEEKLRQLMKGASADDEQVGAGEKTLGVAEFFIIVAEILCL